MWRLLTPSLLWIAWRARRSKTDGTSRPRGAVYFLVALIGAVGCIYVTKFFYRDQTFSINANTEVVNVRLGGPQEFFAWYVGDARLYLFREMEDETETVENGRVCRALIKVPNGFSVRFQRIARGALEITLNRRDVNQEATLFHRPNDSRGGKTCRCPGDVASGEEFGAAYQECQLSDYAVIRIEDPATLSKEGQTRVFPIKGDVVIGNDIGNLAIPDEVLLRDDTETVSGAYMADIQQVPGQPILRSGTVTIRGESIFSGNFFEARRVALDPGDSVAPVTENNVFSAGFVAIEDCEGCLGLRAVVNALGERVTVRHWGAKGYDLSVKDWDGYTKDPVAQFLWTSLFTVASLLWILFEVFGLLRPGQPMKKNDDQGSEKNERESRRRAESIGSATTGLEREE